MYYYLRISALTSCFLGVVLFSCNMNSAPVRAAEPDCVVLLHGLARSEKTMGIMQNRLRQSGYKVVNQGYPSREYAIQELAQMAVGEGLKACGEQVAGQVHFVTHSLGGILVRAYFRHNDRSNLGRVVMLGPPDRGSEIVDNLKTNPMYYWLNGPAGMQLGTSSDDLPSSLGEVNFDLGIIAGTRSINPGLSTIIPGLDDGKYLQKGRKLKACAASCNCQLPIHI